MVFLLKIKCIVFPEKGDDFAVVGFPPDAGNLLQKLGDDSAVGHDGAVAAASGRLMHGLKKPGKSLNGIFTAGQGQLGIYAPGGVQRGIA